MAIPERVGDELIHPELDEVLRREFDTNPDAFSVYADWLEERGDPRAELIRLQVRSQQIDREFAQNDPESVAAPDEDNVDRGLAEALIDEQWDHWFPKQPRQGLHLEWSCGFVREVTVRGLSRVSPQLELPGLLELPSLRFVRSLTIEASEIPVTAQKFAGLRCLERLVWRPGPKGTLRGLRDVELSALKTLVVHLPGRVTDDEIDGLVSARLPSVQNLTLEGDETDKERTFKALPRASWFSLLRQVRTTGFCDGLVLLRPPNALVNIRCQIDGPTIEKVPVVSKSPRFAPTNYRELPSWSRIVLPEPRSASEMAFQGSGVRRSRVAKHSLSFCFACGSHQVQWLYDRRRTPGPLKSGSALPRYEFECLECGLYTSNSPFDEE